jgi:predicted RNA-binding protein with PIN domain
MSQPQRIVIDGYNVIYADDRLRKRILKDLEGARAAFVSILKAYLEDRDLRVTLVFDGRGGMTDAEAVVPGRLQVLYSSAGQTADDIIVELVENSGNPRQIGAKRFLGRVRAPKKMMQKDHEEASEEDMGDTDYWLRKFGESTDE